MRLSSVRFSQLFRRLVNFSPSDWDGHLGGELAERLDGSGQHGRWRHAVQKHDAPVEIELLATELAGKGLLQRLQRHGLS